MYEWDNSWTCTGVTGELCEATVRLRPEEDPEVLAKRDFERVHAL